MSSQLQKQQQRQQPRVVKVKLEENRQLVDCLLLKEPTTHIDFKLLYSKNNPVQKARHINQGTALGWCKVLSNNQFLAYVNVRYKQSGDGDTSSDDHEDDNNNNNNNDDDSDNDNNNHNNNNTSKSTTKPNSSTSSSSNTPATPSTTVSHFEAHELPHILCTLFFKDVSLTSLIKTNNIKPPKPNTVIDPNNPPPRLPIVPSYIYAQKRLFVKWRYEIAHWWSRHSTRLEKKKDKPLTLFQQFQRANPEFRSITLGKQWFFQLMKLFETDEKSNIPIQQRVETFQKEMKFATEGVRAQNTEFVAPTVQRRLDQIRDDIKRDGPLPKIPKEPKVQPKQPTRQQQVQKQQQQQSSSDSSDDDDHHPSPRQQPTTMHDDSSSSDDSSEEEPRPPQKQQQSTTTIKQPQRKNFNDSDSDDSSSEEEEEEEPPQTKPQQKKMSSPSTTTATTKGKILPATMSAALKVPSTNKIQPIKRKNFDSSSSDSDSSDDEEIPAQKIQPILKKQRR